MAIGLCAPSFAHAGNPIPAIGLNSTPRVAAALSPLPQWPRFRGNNQASGVGRGSGADGFITWQINDSDGSYHSPSIGSDGTIYVGNDDWNVYALNPVDGSTIWATATGGAVESTPTISNFNGWLYVGSDDALVYALDPGTGAIQWTFGTSLPVTGSPVVGSDGTVYVDSQDGNVYALDGATGALNHFYSTSVSLSLVGDEFVTSPCMDTSGNIYVDDSEGNVYEFDPSLNLLNNASTSSTSPLSDLAIDPNNNFVFSSLNGFFFSYNSSFGANFTEPCPQDPGLDSAIDASGNTYEGQGPAAFVAQNATGGNLWTVGFGNTSPPILGSDGTVYMGDVNNDFDALNGSNGNVLWQIPNVHVTQSPAIGSDGTLYFADTNGNFYKVASLPFQVSLLPSTVVGGNSSLATVSLENPAPAGGYTVTLSSNNAAASVPASITIPAGHSTGTFHVTTAGTSFVATATIKATIGVDSATALIHINPATAASLTVRPTFTTGGIRVSGVFSLNGFAGSGGFPANLSSSDTNATVPATITVPAGKSAVTFTIATNPVSVEDDLTISAKSGLIAQPGEGGFTLTASLSLFPYPITSFYLSPSTFNGGTGTHGVIQLGGPAGAAGDVVSLTDTDPNVSFPSTVTVPAGQTGISFAVTSTQVTSIDSGVLSAQLDSSSANAGYNLYPYPLSVFYVSPSTVIGGQWSRGHLHLAGPAPSTGYSVTISSVDSHVTVPSSVSFSTGQTDASFNIPTTAVGSQDNATIRAQLGSTLLSATLTINPPSISNFYLSSSSIICDSTVQYVVQLNEPAPNGGATVTVTPQMNSYMEQPGTLTIPAGATGASATIDTGPVTSSQSVTFTATYGSSSAQVTLTVNPVMLNTFYISPNTVTGGKTTYGVVQLTLGFPAAITVNLSTTDPNVTIPSSVTIPANVLGVSFPIATKAVSASDIATITATYQSTSLQATVGIGPS